VTDEKTRAEGKNRGCSSGTRIAALDALLSDAKAAATQSPAEREQLPLVPDDVDPSDIQHPPDIDKYGRGGWFYLKSAETFDPKHAFRRLLLPGERDTFDFITFLVFRSHGGNNPSWIIRCAANWLSRQMGGKPAPRTIEKHLEKFRRLHMLALHHFDKRNGNTYPVADFLMAASKRGEYRHHEYARQLSSRFRALPAPPVKAQARGILVPDSPELGDASPVTPLPLV